MIGLEMKEADQTSSERTQSFPSSGNPNKLWIVNKAMWGIVDMLICFVTQLQ